MKKMSKEQLVEALNALNSNDPEHEHSRATELLLSYINDENVKRAFDEVFVRNRYG